MRSQGWSVYLEVSVDHVLPVNVLQCQYQLSSIKPQLEGGKQKHSIVLVKSLEIVSLPDSVPHHHHRLGMITETFLRRKIVSEMFLLPHFCQVA
jgi:hypothetical protein